MRDRMTSTPWRSIWLPIVLGSLGTAQERVATSGRILGSDGKPVANAMVRFLGSEPPLGDRFEPVDLVEVVTNDKGRFAAQLRERFDYACWATGPAGADGVRATSEALEVRPGAGFEITLTTTTSRRRIGIAGLEAWREHGPLRLEAAPALAHLRATPLEIVDGGAELPDASPGCAWLLFVRDGAGALLWGERLEPGAAPVDFEMPPPRTIPVRVVDDQGKPVADAAIRVDTARVWRSPAGAMTPPPSIGEWRVAGRTGVDGTAQIVTPCRTDPFQDPRAARPMLLASKRDYAGALSGWNGQQIQDNARFEGEPAKTELSFTLRPQPSFRGRLIGADGKGRAGVAVGLSGQCVMQLQGGTLHSPSVFTTTTAPDGTWCFDSLPPFDAPVLHVPGADARGWAPALITPDLSRPFEFDARCLATLDLRVLDLDGGPARNADVVLLPSPVGEHQLDGTTWRCRLDSRGTAQLHVQPGEWSIIVTDRRGLVHATTKLAGKTLLQLSFDALPVLRAVVRLPADESPQAVRLFINCIIHSSGNPTEAEAMLRAAGTRLNQWFAECTSVRADGTFELPFLDVPGTKYSGGVQLGPRVAKLSLKAAAEPIELVLRAR